MTQLSRRSLSLADGVVSYLEGGDGPTLHFAHATGFNAETYAPLLSPLTERLRVLAADARGHGFTVLPTGPDMARNWTIYRDDLVRFLDATAGCPALLAGHSMGAVTSAMMAAQFPERVTGLVLIEPVLMPFLLGLVRWLPFRTASTDLASRAERRRDRFASFDVALASYRGRGAFRTWPEDFLRAYLKGGLVSAGQDAETKLACAPAWEAQTFRGSPMGAAHLARQVRCPVTLLYAEHSTPPERECKLFARLHGNTRLIKVPGTTHFLPMERPEIVQKEIASMAV